MLRYFRALTEPFSDRYRQYLPLATSTPRGSVSAQSDSTYLYPGSRPSSPPLPISTVSGSSTYRNQKSAFRRRSLSWHVRVLLLLSVIGYVLHTCLGSWLSASGATEGARLAALNLLRQQLSAEAIANTTDGRAHSVHRLFADMSPGVSSRQLLPIRAYDALSDECIEEWVVHQHWGPACRGTDLSEGLKFDAVFAWVNGSDPAQILARNTYKPSSPINVDASHRYADHNELVYSMRSLYQAFGDSVVAKMHIMASAYPLPEQAREDEDKDKTMVGQVPYWLNSTDLGNGKIALHHDANFFSPMQPPLGSQLSASDVDAWRTATLPSFNSLAVESQLYNLPHASSDQMVYLNDDFFTLTRLSVSDVHSPLFGPVIKTDTRLISWYRPSEHPLQRWWNPAGEEVGIKRAAWTLGKRFGMRSLPYITHHPRSLSLPLLREAAATFPSAFDDTALARFRAQKEVPDSVQAVFLASWYVVERHREALLWSWVVAKWGGTRGQISSEMKSEMWNEIGGDRERGEMDVGRPVRQSRDEAEEVFDKAGVPRPVHTQYSFSSQDGHALSYLDWSWPWERPREGYPDLSGRTRSHGRSWTASTMAGASPRVCRLSLSCFAPALDESADALFKRIAFEHACGDCLVAALLGVSGSSGISAFLPTSDTIIRVPADAPGSSAHLPLTPQWQSTNFSLAHVLPSPPDAAKDIPLRTWCTRLIQRYTYTLGATRSTFRKVEYASRLAGQLSVVDSSLDSETPTTFLCLNDDIKEDERGTRAVNTILRAWFASHWKTKLPGEVS